MTPHILIVDDDPDICELISIYIGSFNYTFDAAKDAEDALEKISKERFHILLTDLELPRMNGDELLRRIGESNPDMIGIVMSVHGDVERVLPFLNHENICDYLVKPFEPEALKKTIDQAFDKYHLRIKEKVLTEREKTLYDEFISNMDWKKELRAKHTDSIALQLIHQLNISFFQGQGVGSLISTVGMMMNRAKHDAEAKEYTIPEKLYNLMAENYAHATKMVQCFMEAQQIIMRTHLYEERHPVGLIKNIADECKQELKSQMYIKTQGISISELPASLGSRQAILDPENIKIIITELLFNAMKYSGEKARIYVLFFHKSSHLEVKFINPALPLKEKEEALNGKNEVLVFEPFYRLAQNVDDRYEEKFRYGLGLTVVQKIVDLHGANIFIYSILNNLKTEPELKADICVTLRFPLLEEDK